MIGNGRILSLSAVLCWVWYSCASDPIVDLGNGHIRGSVMLTEDNKTFYAFRGIPYAEPPKRFQPPEPKKQWPKDPVDATKNGPCCLQADYIMKKVTGEEDCLYLNIYTTQIPKDPKKEELLTVMVYIHGGAFEIGCGTSDFYGPGRLMDSGIVLVTINYRLGPLGFFSTEDSNSPGNYGLLDQTEALKWIKKYIRHFGGDSQRMTIVGNSAGGASVIYHLLSPLSKGLYNNAIALSGTPLCPWAFQEQPKFWASKLAERLECPASDSSEMVKCLQNHTGEDITRAGHFFEHSFLPAAFAPSIDKNFLPDSPINLMKEGKVQSMPLIIGILPDEGAVNVALIEMANPSKTKFTQEEILSLLKPIFKPGKSQTEAAKFIQQKYFKASDYSNEEKMRKNLIRIFSEGLFKSCHYQTVKLMSEAQIPTYVYSYDYATNYTFLNAFGYLNNLGVSHMDELFNLFDGPIFGRPVLGKLDKKIGIMMRSLLASFAKTGKPVHEDVKSKPQWMPVKDGRIQVYHINEHVFVDEFQFKKNEWLKWWNENIQQILKKEQKDEL